RCCRLFDLVCVVRTFASELNKKAGIIRRIVVAREGAISSRREPKAKAEISYCNRRHGHHDPPPSCLDQCTVMLPIQLSEMNRKIHRLASIPQYLTTLN